MNVAICPCDPPHISTCYSLEIGHPLFDDLLPGGGDHDTIDFAKLDETVGYRASSNSFSRAGGGIDQEMFIGARLCQPFN